MFRNQFRTRPTTLIALVAISLFCTNALAQQAPRERISINTGWRFTKGDPDGTGEKLAYANIKDWVMATGENLRKSAEPPRRVRPQGNIGEDVAYTRADFNDSTWRQLDLPHDWAIEGPFDAAIEGNTGKLPFAGVGWYRKTLAIPAGPANTRYYIDIDGAMSYANVWLNGQYAGGWGYGYSSFRVDLTPYIRAGADNVLAIRLDNPPTSSRWYPGAGLYRNVWLVKTSPVHVGQWGTYITTPDVSTSSATVDVKATIDNRSANPWDVSVKTEVFELDASDQRGRSVGSTAPVLLSLAPNEPSVAAARVTVANPKLWGIKTPNRYLAVTTIQVDGRLVDSYETPFGIRSVTFDPDKGVILNGEAMKFQGVCNHHDLGALGGAVNVRALERQLQILHEMGTNAVRTAHNPPSPELLTLCDKMGFMVIDEAFDCWARQKRANDYHLLFPDWHEKDVRTLIRRDRNHPSVVVWSTGNEVGELGAQGGAQVSAMLTAIVRDEDPSRPVTVGSHTYNAGFNGFQNTVDLFGWNYLRPGANNFAMYDAFRAQNPGKFVYSSESASTISTRGFYLFPMTDNKGGGYSPTEQQMSSYDLYAPAWASQPEWEWRAQDQSPFAAGEFVWTGFDYLGEPTVNGGGGGRGRGRGAATAPAADAAPAAPAAAPPPNTRRSSYFGIIDLAGFPKDRYYLYQSRWRPDLKMAHILPHWNWPDRVGQVTPVHVYTAADEGELFVNGKSQGRKKKAQFEYRLMWNEVTYEPGEVKVVTYKAGQPWAEAVTKTTGAASKVALKPDRPTITADGNDLSFVTVSVADTGGTMVPRSMNLLKFELSGPGEIVAVDNGDASSLVSFKSKEMKAFNGLCLVIVRSKPGQAGDMTLRVTSDGLEAGTAMISGVLRR